MRKWTEALPTLGAFALSAAVFSQLPGEGRVDFSPLVPEGIPASGGPVPRVAAALAVPTVAIAVWVLLSVLRRVKGPARAVPEWWLNEETGAAAVTRFEPTYSTIIFSVTALVALIHAVFVGSLLEWPEWIYRVFTAVLGFGLMAAGNVMPRVRPNWIVGLRTKRTLSDPHAWSRTHRVLGRSLIVAGSLVIIASAVAPRYALVTGLVALLSAFLFSHQMGTRPGNIAHEV